MSTKRYFVIAGTGHSASTWLASTFNAFVDTKVSHEAFGKNAASWLGDLRRWIAIDSPIVGDANPYATFYPTAIEYAVQPQWAFIWRHPFTVVHRSMESQHPTKEQIAVWPQHISERIQTIYGALERTLQMLANLKRPATHWAYPKYTTSVGLLELAQGLALEPPGNWTLPAPENVTLGSHPVPLPKAWSGEFQAHVIAFLRTYPLCWSTLTRLGVMESEGATSG